MSHAEIHLRALTIAQRLLDLDARPGTVATITGISQREIHRLFPPNRIRSGRWPSTHEWYHTANLVQRVEASLFAVHYCRNRTNEFAIVESLIDAYRRYRQCVGAQPCVSIDRAFNLVCHLEGGVWGVAARSFDLAACPKCRCEHLIQLGGRTPNDGCIFCRFVLRFRADPRLQSHFPAKALPDVGNFTARLRP